MPAAISTPALEDNIVKDLLDLLVEAQGYLGYGDAWERARQSRRTYQLNYSKGDGKMKTFLIVIIVVQLGMVVHYLSAFNTFIHIPLTVSEQ